MGATGEEEEQGEWKFLRGRCWPQQLAASRNFRKTPVHGLAFGCKIGTNGGLEGHIGTSSRPKWTVSEGGTVQGRRTASRKCSHFAYALIDQGRARSWNCVSLVD
jgi:hypothetical protein